MSALAIVIPARYAATRLPGKPLRSLAGRPLVEWVYRNAIKASADEVIVAVDDERIASVVQAFGGTALMTDRGHASGTDRLAEVAERRGWPDDTIVVNLQGDEPAIGAPLLQRVAEGLRATPEAGIATVATPIHESADLFDPNVVKVVVDGRGLALYFSRAPIPWHRGSFGAADRPRSLPQGVDYLRHLGLYAYRVGTLRRVAASPPSALERAEALEQLRALHLGIHIHVSVIEEAPGHGVDTEEDLRRVEAQLSKGGA